MKPVKATHEADPPITVELRNDGWYLRFRKSWIGPFEFMTQAEMLRLELERYV